MIRISIVVLIAALSVAGMTTLAGQQGSGSARAKDGATARANPPAALPGPRLTPRWPSYELVVPQSGKAAPLFLASGNDNHTFVFSTLALVLIGVIVVLLVVK